MMQKKLLIKIVVLGDSGVGKTSLLNQFCYHRFSEQYRATIGADFQMKDIFVDDRAVTLQIWDTAGQERFQSLGVAFYRGANACVLVYDITNANTFASLDKWKNEFLKQANLTDTDTFPFIVIGNKLDKNEDRQVSKEEVETWCSNQEQLQIIPSYETTAKDPVIIDELLRQLAKTVVTNQLNQSTTTPPPTVRLYESESRKASEKFTDRCC